MKQIRRLRKRKSNMLNRRLDRWEKKRNIMGIPQDDIERTRRHYLGCKIWYAQHNIIKNLLAISLLPIGMLIGRQRRNISKIKSVDAVITCSNKAFLLKDKDIPPQLKECYKVIVKKGFEKKSLYREFASMTLDSDAKEIVKRCIRRYPFAFYLDLHILLKLSRIYKLIYTYAPKAIITTQTEQDYTTSIITWYCERKGIKYIGIQHGEYSYNPSMAYVRFSEYYAWNKETISILELTNTSINNAYVYTPNRLKHQYKKLDAPKYFLTYYLSDEGKTEIHAIKKILIRFTQAGFMCCVRCHPRTKIQKYIEMELKNTGIDLEDSQTVPIGYSMSNTKYIVAYNSTVLSEAFANEMPIVIDDLVGDIRYLERVHDANLGNATMLLSDLIEYTILETQ